MNTITQNRPIEAQTNFSAPDPREIQITEFALQVLSGIVAAVGSILLFTPAWYLGVAIEVLSVGLAFAAPWFREQNPVIIQPPGEVKIDTRHFEEVLEAERSIPEYPNTLRPRDIALHFQKINYQHPNAPCYVFKGGDHPDLQEIKELFQGFTNDLTGEDHWSIKFNERVGNVGSRYEIYLCAITHTWNQINDNLINPTSPSYISPDDSRLVNKPETRTLYDKQIKAANTRNYYLAKIYDSLDGCTNRTRMAIEECFRNCCGLPPLTIGEQIKHALLEHRRNLVNTIGNEIARDRNLENNEAEIIDALLNILGPLKGISADPIDSVHHFANLEPIAIRKFDAAYCKENIVNLVKEWIDGFPSVNQSNIPVRNRQIELSDITEWFKDHMPENYTTTSEDYPTPWEHYQYTKLYEKLNPEAEYPDYGIKRSQVARFLQAIGVVL